MTDYISRVEAFGLHGRFDIEVDLLPRINVLYGRNGSGKTTLLHILANILNGSFGRFAFLEFREIRLFTGSGSCLKLCRYGESTISTMIDGETVDTFDVNKVRAQERRGEREDIPTEERNEIGTLQLSDRFPVHGAVYFPAFRTMIEAWSDEAMRPTRFRAHEFLFPPSESWRRSRAERITSMARGLFGEFVPELRYPSLAQIESDLSSALMSAAYRVVNEGQASLSEAFLDAFAAIMGQGPTREGNPEEILVDIQGMLEELNKTKIVRFPDGKQEDVYERLRRMIPEGRTGALSDTAANVLAVYRKSLKQRIEVQREAFAPFERYVDSVNEFLEGKRLLLKPYAVRSPRAPLPAPALPVLIEFDDGSTASLLSLSSGERQIVSMLYAATYLSGKDNVVLIDEPEISLHVDWQRRLLPRMAQQLGDRQIIVCTHAPEIAGEYDEEFQEIRLIPSSKQGSERDRAIAKEESGEMLL